MIEPQEEHWVGDHTGPAGRLWHSAKRDSALRNDDRLDFTGAIRDEVDRQNESVRYRQMLDGSQQQSPILSENRKPRPSYEREKINVTRLLISAALASFAIVFFWYNTVIDPPSLAELDHRSWSREHTAVNVISFVAALLALTPYLKPELRKWLLSPSMILQSRYNAGKPSGEKREPILPSSLAEQVSPERQKELFIEDHATEQELDWEEYREFISYNRESPRW